MTTKYEKHYDCDWPTSFTLGQLRAYKAHLTMGTYKEKANGGLEK